MELRGRTEPRLFTAPLRELTPETSLGFAVIEFAEDVLGVELLPWQRWLFIHALELRQDGRLRFRTVLVLVARQNGKTTWAQVLSLFRLYVSGVKLVLGTAQDLDIAQDVWEGAVEMAESIPDLAAEIEKVNYTNGKHALNLTGKRKYKVKAATRKGGRGLSGDLVLLDELREHTDWEAWGALTKTTMARPLAQVVGLSNAGDAKSVVLNHLRAQAIKGADDPESALFLAEWSAPEDCDLADIEAWAQANPSLGYTITLDAIKAAYGTDPVHVFQAEVLCQRPDHGAKSQFPDWPDCAADGGFGREGRIAFGLDVSWDRSRLWIVAASEQPGGRIAVEVAASGDNDGDWWVDYLKSRVEQWKPLAVAIQATGAPASSLLPDLEAAIGSAKVMKLTGQDLGKACGLMSDLTRGRLVAHNGEAQLADAAQFATVRGYNDAWIIDRKTSPVDVAPLMAATQAVWACRNFQEAESKPLATIWGR